ncbi:hypothetical protein L9F63_026779, partial [Diploptera punctata]
IEVEKAFRLVFLTDYIFCYYKIKALPPQSIYAAYQSCPCPMQSCPKNVHTGPLTGDVALALPLEPPGALGPPSPARGSAGMPPPPSPATASARNPNQTEQETALQQRLWDTSNAESQSQVELKNKQEIQLTSLEVTKDLQTLPDNDFKSEATVLPTDEAADKTDITRNSLLAISKVSNSDILCRTKSKKTCPTTPNNVPLLMCDVEFQKKRQNSSETAITKAEKTANVDPKIINNTVKSEVCNVEKEELTENKISEVQNGRKAEQKFQLQKDVNCQIQMLVVDYQQKTQSLSSSNCSMHNGKNVRKRKLDDGKDLAEIKEPASKKKSIGIRRLQNKIYPSRVKNIKKIASSTGFLKKSFSLIDNSVCKKVTGSRTLDQKKGIKMNGVFSQQKKPSLRHQVSKGYQSAISCLKSCAQAEKKTQHCKKSVEEVGSARNKCKVNHMLRSHRLHESDNTFSDDNKHRGKPDKVPANRRTSVGSRKEQYLAVVGYRKSIPKKTLQLPKWSNGWQFEGEPFESKVFLSSDDVLVTRKCYPLMRHQEGDVICPRDCILLKSGPRKTDLPFVAKVAALWENPEDGEMMVSLLWYYRPEHTDQGRRADDMEDEIFASKHKDINSVACIEDKCYVLTFNEYCRYRKCVRRLEEGVKEPGLVVPQHDEYPRENKQPPGCVATELVFFCRRVYDFRQRRILKNPGIESYIYAWKLLIINCLTIDYESYHIPMRLVRKCDKLLFILSSVLTEIMLMCTMKLLVACIDMILK